MKTARCSLLAGRESKKVDRVVDVQRANSTSSSSSRDTATFNILFEM